MSGVFQNIDPPPPHRPASVYPPPLVGVGGGGHTRGVERGWEVNILEDARHSSVLYIRKDFVHKIRGHEDVAPSYMSPNAGDRGEGASGR